MKAPHFELLGVDGRRYSPVTARGDNGLLVMFICNHCPYVKAVLDRIIRECGELASQGIGSIAIMPNDPTDYPDDSFDNMKRVAAEKRFHLLLKRPIRTGQWRIEKRSIFRSVGENLVPIIGVRP